MHLTPNFQVDFSSISEKEAKVLQVIHDLTVDMEKLTIVTKKLNAYSEELEKEDEAAKAAEAEVAGLGKVAPVSTSGEFGYAHWCEPQGLY